MVVELTWLPFAVIGNSMFTTAVPRSWHFVTGEYPPDLGGVSDYTAAVAGALADSGAGVHVWAPGESTEQLPPRGGVVRRVAREFGASGLVRRMVVARSRRHAPELRSALSRAVPADRIPPVERTAGAARFRKSTQRFVPVSHYESRPPKLRRYGMEKLGVANLGLILPLLRG
jgi:hypothetical protein